MADISPIVTNFTAGAISPLLAARTDFAKYPNACSILENMIVLPHGPAQKRPGFRFVAEVKASNKFTRLVPFQYSTEQAYMLEFGDEYIRFYMDLGRILDGSDPYEISSPYLAEDLPGLKWCQSADTMYLVHPDYSPRKLTRSGHTAWTLTEVDFQDGPLLIQNDTDITFSPSALTGTTILTASEDFFQPGHAGALFRIDHEIEKVLDSTTKPFNSATSATKTVLKSWTDDEMEIVETVAADFTSTDTGDAIAVAPGNHIRYRLEGTWAGTMKLQRSYDGGTTWGTWKTLTGNTDVTAENASGVTALYRWTCTAYTSGTIETDLWHLANYTLLSDPVTAGPGDTITWSLSGTWTGTVRFQWKESGGSWEIYDDYTSNVSLTVTKTSDSEARQYRWFLVTYGSGTINASIELTEDRKEAYSETIHVASGDDVLFSLTGTWIGTMLLQRSWDGGANWDDWKQYTENVDDEETNNMTAAILVRWKHKYYTSGTATSSLSTIHTSSGKGSVRIIQVTGPTKASATVIEELFSTEATDLWYEGAWSDYRGWPRAVTFFEDRLCFAGSQSYPQTLWLSKVGDYERFGPDLTEDEDGTEDDASLEVALLSQEANPILWIRGERSLVIGTTRGEWRFGATDPSTPAKPTDVSAKEQTHFGCADLQSIKVGHSVLFVQRGARKVRELTPDWMVDGYVSVDLAVLSEHLAKPGISDWAYQQDPDSIVWMVRSDGALLGMSYLKEQDIVAWHLHSTDGEFESVASIAGDDRDEVWVIVKRTIGGGTRRYVELMEASFDSDTSTVDAFLVDSGLTYDGASTTVVTGLDHLKRKTVVVLTDGAAHPACKVDSDGQITLNWPASVVQVGLPYTAKLRTMRLDFQLASGTVQGKVKRIGRTIVRLYQTVNCRIGPDEDYMDSIEFRSLGDPMGTPIVPFTGDKVVDAWQADFTRDGYIMLKHEDPLPITVVGIMPELTL